MDLEKTQTTVMHVLLVKWLDAKIAKLIILHVLPAQMEMQSQITSVALMKTVQLVQMM